MAYATTSSHSGRYRTRLPAGKGFFPPPRPPWDGLPQLGRQRGRLGMLSLRAFSRVVRAIARVGIAEGSCFGSRSQRRIRAFGRSRLRKLPSQQCFRGGKDQREKVLVYKVTITNALT